MDRGRSVRERRLDIASTSRAEAQIERINVLTRTARTSWFGLLSYLAFVGVTLMGVEDADFFISERQTQLPLVGVSVPTLLFFAVAPTLGVALYSYFHLHLLKLWDALAVALPPPKRLPKRSWQTIFFDRPMRSSNDITRPDDEPLGDAIAPWLVTDLALSFRPDAQTYRPLRRVAFFATAFLSFLAGPLVLFFFWLWSMPSHNELLTIVGCGVPLCVCMFVCVSSWWHMRKRVLKAPQITPNSRKMRYTSAWLVFAVVTLVGWLTTEGSFKRYATEYFGVSEEQTEGKWWASEGLNAFLVSANLSSVDFVDANPGLQTHDIAKNAFRVQWCQDQDIPAQACGSDDDDDTTQSFVLKQRRRWCAELLTFPDNPSQSCDLRFVQMERDFDRAWREARTKQFAGLIPRNLANRDLRGASLWRAHLEGAILWGAHLERADLGEAHLEGAYVLRAHQEGAILRDAHLEGASLWGAHLEVADLWGAHLEAANLREAHLEGANLGGAHLEGADLKGAHLDGANLGDAHLEGANLWEAHFDQNTNFNGAVVQYATVNSIDLSMVNLDQTQVNSMFGDGTMTAERLPKGISRPAHWPTITLGLEITEGVLVDRLLQERDKWMADPRNYVPPTE